MKTILFPIYLIIIIFFSSINIFAADKSVESIVVTQLDTFALKAMPAQPILKINIKVTGTTGSLYLQNLTIHTLNQDNADVDSVAVYYSYAPRSFDNFSLTEYPAYSLLLDKRKKIIGDSAVLDNLSHSLETGDNIFWVTMDLYKYSYASHTLDAFVKANGIKVGGSFFPSTLESPSGSVNIAEVFFRDNFESLNEGKPVGWEQDPNIGLPLWINNVGGHKVSAAGYPEAPKSGAWNVLLYKESSDADSTLLLKNIDLSLSNKPLLTFYHAQERRCKGDPCVYDNDKLRVRWKIGTGGAWNELKYYFLYTNGWVKRAF